MAAEDILSLFRRHGGRLGDARKAFPAAPLPWIDLSTGVNPYAWQGPRAVYTALQKLPDTDDIAAVERVAAASFGCAPEHIAALPGADIGLRLLPHILHANTAAIVSPTYQGHADAWASVAVETITRDALSTTNADVLIVVNPNNPDGAVIGKDVLLNIAKRQHQRGGWLIVDESFADIVPNVSVAAHVQPGLIVLRSFGKFYGLPGARLGFVLGPESIIKAIRTFTGDWPISADAVQLALGAYADTAWQQRTREALAATATRLNAELTANGFKVIGGTSLFRLTARADANRAFLKLAAHGILVRPFEYEPTWLRFGLPTEVEWPRVIAALKDCRHE